MKRPLVPYISILAGVALWSTIEVVSKHVSPDVSASQIAMIRFLLGGIVVLPFGVFVARRARFHVDVRFLAACAALGVCGTVICMWCFHRSLHYLDAGPTAALFCGHPIVVALLAALLMGERITRRAGAGVVIGLVGVAILSVAQFHGFPDGGRMDALSGVALIAVAGVFFALYTVGLKAFHKRGATILAFCLSSIIGSLLLLVPATWGTSMAAFSAAVSRNARPLLFLTLASTGAGYLFYFWGLSHVPTSSGASMIYVKPVIAVALAMIFLHEPLRPSLVVGVALIVIGVALAVRSTPSHTPS